MQAQIPLWVTLALAIIAIMGPIGGAAIGGTLTARRDDKRWQRELERENQQYWRNLRATVYSNVIESHRKYLSVARELLTALSVAASSNDLDDEDLPEHRDNLVAAGTALDISLLHAEICSTTKMQYLSVKLGRHAAEFEMLAIQTMVALRKEDKDDLQAKLTETDQHFNSIREMNNEYIDGVKDVLAIPGGNWNESD
jgi:hypothetical protein